MLGPRPTRQIEALAAIEEYRRATGGTPSVRTLALLLGVTSSAAHQLIQKLRARGALAWGGRIAVVEKQGPAPTPAGERGGFRRVVGFGVS